MPRLDGIMKPTNGGWENPLLTNGLIVEIDQYQDG